MAIKLPAALAGIYLLGACASAHPSTADQTIPTDGVHITGAVSAVYPISNGGTCFPVTAPSPQLGISSNSGAGQAFFGATVNNFAGPKTYTDVGWPPPGHSTLYVSYHGTTWRAGSGLISVKFFADGNASGTLWAVRLKEVGGSTTVNAAGSWTCHIVPPPAEPSPSPAPAPSPPVGTGPSPTPAGTAVDRQALPPAIDLPVVALCSTPVQNFADGNAGPLFCASGALNVLAWRFYADVSSSVLGLGLNPTPGQAQGAMCDDIKRSHATGPQETSAYKLASTYYGWSFNVDPAHLSCQ